MYTPEELNVLAQADAIIARQNEERAILDKAQQIRARTQVPPPDDADFDTLQAKYIALYKEHDQLGLNSTDPSASRANQIAASAIIEKIAELEKSGVAADDEKLYNLHIKRQYLHNKYLAEKSAETQQMDKYCQETEQLADLLRKLNAVRPPLDDPSHDIKVAVDGQLVSKMTCDGVYSGGYDY